MQEFQLSDPVPVDIPSESNSSSESGKSGRWNDVLPLIVRLESQWQSPVLDPQQVRRIGFAYLRSGLLSTRPFRTARIGRLG